MNVQPKLEEVIPRLRGVLHAYAFWFAAIAAVTLVAVSYTHLTLPTNREV